MPSIRESSNESLEYGAVSIDIRGEEQEEEQQQERMVGGRTQSAERAVCVGRRREEAWRFPRSHSTGHSITGNNGGTTVDKYTLRFPDHVEVKITRGHTGSCITFGEASQWSKGSRNGAFGEVSGSAK